MPSSNKIAAVITDLGGVLINVDHSNMCTELAKHSPLPAEEIGRHLSGYVVHSSGAERDLSKGLITPQQFFAVISKQIQLRGIGFREFERIYSDRFTRKEGFIAIIRKLSKKYAVAMLSNTNAMHYPYWSRVLGRDMKLFKELVLSFNVGYAKPDSRIFLGAAKKLKTKPEQCVYIDDFEEYVEAARKLGMKGITLSSARQLETDLKKLGVSF